MSGMQPSGPGVNLKFDFQLQPFERGTVGLKLFAE
jgi:hypothetical protein